MYQQFLLESLWQQSLKLLRIDDTLGSIETGKIADIIAVKGDPLKDISVLKDIALVIKDGKVYK